MCYIYVYHVNRGKSFMDTCASLSRDCPVPAVLRVAERARGRGRGRKDEEEIEKRG